MKIVYRAAHSTDAHLVRQLLEHEGMTAFVNGGLLEGGAGELPMSGLVTVSVADEHEARAREVVREWESMPVPPDDEDEGAAPAEVAAATPQRRSWAPVLVAALLGAAFGAALTWNAMRTRVDVLADDVNRDGATDQRSIYEDGQLVRTENDRNHDGQDDEIASYGKDGRLSGLELDDNFDGYMETNQLYDARGWLGTTIDTDGDGKPDYRVQAEHTVLAREEWLNARGDVIKRVAYERLVPSRGEFDSDGDGKLDTARRYDARGEIVSAAPIAP